MSVIPTDIGYAVRRWVARPGLAITDVTVDPESYPNGRFARLYDPEGNPVELWEPL